MDEPSPPPILPYAAAGDDARGCRLPAWFFLFNLPLLFVPLISHFGDGSEGLRRITTLDDFRSEVWQDGPRTILREIFPLLLFIPLLLGWCHLRLSARATGRRGTFLFIVYAASMASVASMVAYRAAARAIENLDDWGFRLALGFGAVVVVPAGIASIRLHRSGSREAAATVVLAMVYCGALVVGPIVSSPMRSEVLVALSLCTVQAVAVLIQCGRPGRQ